MTAEAGTSVCLQSHSRGDVVLQFAVCEPRADLRLEVRCRGVYLADAVLLPTMLKPPSHPCLNHARRIACGSEALAANVPWPHKACRRLCWVASRKRDVDSRLVSGAARRATRGNNVGSVTAHEM